MAAHVTLATRTRYRLEQALYLSIKALFRVSPSSLKIGVGRALGRFAFMVDRRHRRVAIDNLHHALPDLDEKDRQRLARQSFESMASAAVDAVSSCHLRLDQLPRRFDDSGWSHFEAAEAQGRGVLLMTAHLGNWEALGQFMALRDKPISFVARPLDNPHLERDFRRIRERLGNRSIAKRGAARQMMRLLRSRSRVGILIDQRVHPDEGRAIPFFGRPAFTTPLLARLSIRTGAPVLPFFGIPLDDWRRIRVEFHEPILPERDSSDTEEVVDALTARYVEVIEKEIRKRPHLWLWAHRRWRQDFDSTATRCSGGPVRSCESIGKPSIDGPLTRS